jgi:cell volume regulation protein A
MDAEPFLLVGAGLVLLAVLSSRVAGRLGIPALLLFLGLGMLAGSDGPGGIDFADAELGQSVGIGALALILFDGGLSTRWGTVRPVLGPGLTLATVSVVVTAAITGVVAAWAFDLPLETGLLLGAIVSSTDAAAVFAVLRTRRTGLAGGIQPTLELESGANDPMAIFLTIALIEIMTESASGWPALLPMLVAQFAIGAAGGLAAGWAARHAVNRLDLDTDGLYPVLTLAIAGGTYAATALLGGSGFLAVYICGLWLGNRELLHRKSILRFHDAVAWLAQIAMFLVLGLLVFPRQLPDVAGRSLLLVAVLALVARPIATTLALIPFRVPWREQAVIAWVGLRGATPIVLATFPLVEGIPDADVLFDVVFFVVLTSVLLQGTTIDRVARLFGATIDSPPTVAAPLEAGAPLPDGTALRELPIPAGAVADGRSVVDLGLPEKVLLVLVNRNDTYIVPTGATRLGAGDVVLLLASDDVFVRVRDALTAPAGQEGERP